MLVDYWRKFEDSFKRLLENTSDDKFIQAWKTQKARTAFYVNDLLKGVADSLNLSLRSELFKVDYALCKETEGGVRVPLIFVESENSASTAEHEVHKLCALAVPLKVLIVCCEWSNESGYWKHGGCKEKYLDAWSRIIRSHGQVWPQPCVYGFIVAEWNRELRYYSVCLDAFGGVCDEHKVFFQRQIPAAKSEES